MRWVVLVLVLAGCVRDAPAPIARCASCDAVAEPQLGMSNYRHVGNCRVEVRKGDSCCLVRFDVEPPKKAKADQREVHDADGGFSVSVNATIVEQTFQPTIVPLCVGETFTVCGEEIVCAP